jgi:hypothetical protein
MELEAMIARKDEIAAKLNGDLTTEEQHSLQAESADLIEEIGAERRRLEVLNKQGG